MTEIEAGAFTAYVSPEDGDLEDESWFVNSRGYVVNNGSGSHAFKRLHRIVMARMLGRELGQWELVDHIDGDKLNNRRDNLRVCNSSENAFNRDLPAHNTTGYKGVSRNGPAARHPFQASITINRKKIYLGSYLTAQEAAAAYERKAREIAGQYHRGQR